jgi:hypothetical protein
VTTAVTATAGARIAAGIPARCRSATRGSASAPPRHSRRAIFPAIG